MRITDASYASRVRKPLRLSPAKDGENHARALELNADAAFHGRAASARGMKVGAEVAALRAVNLPAAILEGCAGH